MATTRPFAFNTGSTISGTDQVGDLAVGVDAIRYDLDIGGVKWYMGADEDLGWVIGLPVPGTHKPEFWRTAGKNDTSWIAYCDYISRRMGGGSITTASQGYDWVVAEEYWTNYVAPTPSITPTITPTPSTTPPVASPTPTPTPTPSQAVGTGFTTEWVTTVTGTTISLPLHNSGTFNATVDWGDGSGESTITTYDDGDRTHIYADAGTYRVEIRGECPGWSFDGAGYATYLSKILDWGDVGIFGGFQYLRGGFYGCVNLTNIGEDNILSKTALTDLSRLFYNCSSLTTLPTGLFDNNTNVTTFDDTFRGCTSLSAIPSGLFDNNTLVTTFDDTFSNCGSVSAIPTGLFDNNTLVTTFINTFWNCNGLTTLPTGLFDNNINVTSFANTFYFCSNITAIPTGFFDYNTGVTSFGATFYYNTSLTSIPTGLFDNNTLVTNFGVVFRYCRNITSIPSGLFDNNPLVTSFAWTFADCDDITTVPTGLFDNNPLVTSFRETFISCDNLVSIPPHLFEYNTGVTSFRQTLSNCGSLSITPIGLFTGHTLATDFYGVFYRGYAVELHPNIFDESGVSGSTRFFNQSVDFDYAFSIVSSSNYDGSVGTAPELWGYDYGSGTPSTTNSFTGRDDSGVLTNYDDIPGTWL